MGTKTFIFDVRGYKTGLATAVDAALATWLAAETPASVENMDMTMGEEQLVIVVSFTAA